MITGGSSGIGLKTAKELVAEGARVALTARNPEAFEVARRELGEGPLSIASDSSDVSGQKQLAQRVKEDFGNLDILFINAGVTELKPVDQWDEAAFNVFDLYS